MLQNLSLKPHALTELDLPVTVVSGHIERIHVVVPWNQLGSASVQVTIQGIYALVVPNTKLPSVEEREQSKLNQIERQELLRQHDRFAAHKNREGEDESTFLSRLTERITDNLQVTLQDLHIRYEDNQSNPDHPFACGVMLRSFTFHTTDAEGNDVFVDRATKKEKFMHKAAALTHCAVYWDRLVGETTTNTQLLQHQSNIQATMREMVHAMPAVATEGQISSRRQWILRPCSIAVQLTKNDGFDYAVAAKYSIQARVQDLSCMLSREQYEDMIFLSKAFMGRRAVESHVLRARCRPFHNAVARPGEWWDYAVRLVLARRYGSQPKAGNQLLRGLRLRWASIQQTALERKLYVYGFRQQLRKGSPLEIGSKYATIMHDYEQRYPVDVIMAIRNFAEDEEQKEIERKKQASQAASASSGGGSWYSYLFGASSSSSTTATSSEHLANEVLTAEGKADLKHAYDEAVHKEKVQAVPAGCNLLTVKLQLKNGSMALVHRDTPFLTATLDGSLIGNLQPYEEWDAKLRVQRFEIVNTLARDTPFYTFCTLASAAKLANPGLPCVTFDANVRVSDANDIESRKILQVRVYTMPMRVMVDPSFLLRFYGFFMHMLPDQDLEKVWNFATSSVSDWVFSENEEESLYATAMQRDPRKRMQFDVLVDINAPVLVVPESPMDPKGALAVVDLGQFLFKNDIAATSTAPKDKHSSSCDFWSVEMKKMRVLLGTLEYLDWNDEEFIHFSKIVDELSLNFSIQTLAATAFVPRKTGDKQLSADTALIPNMFVQATVPRIVIAIAENQLLTLGRMHSSILAQLAAFDAFSSDNLKISEVDDAKAALSEESVISTKPTLGGVLAATKERFILKMQLLLENVVLNIREASHKDAFRIQITQTSFDLAIFSTQYVFQARLRSLLMEDKLYDSSSQYFKLVSTGEFDDSKPHLISLDVIIYPSTTSTSQDREAQNMVVDAHFNVLHVQWNPSSIALLYRIASSYATALQSHAIESNFGIDAQVQYNGTKQNLSENSEVATESRSYHSVQSALPSILIRASLVQFSVTFNKDQQNRQLVQLSVNNVSTEFESLKIWDQDAGEFVSLYTVSGELGNFIALDLSLAKHELYSPLIGLNASNDSASSVKRRSSSIADALLTFSFTSSAVSSVRSSLSLNFRPVRLVYFHQQVLELVDYLFEGILGTILSHTLNSATQLLLGEDESSMIFRVSVQNPTVILPLRIEEINHIMCTTESLELHHYPSSTVRYSVGGDRKVIHGENPVSLDQKTGSTVLCADSKQIFLKNVNIFCSAETSSTMAVNSSAAYRNVLAIPIDVIVDVDDLVSSGVRLSDSTLLPRFTIKITMTDVELSIQRRDYLMFVALIQDNFGGEQLSAPINEGSAHPDDNVQPSLRPTVVYSYSRSDVDAITMVLTFAMKNLRCRLYEPAVMSDLQDVNASGIVQNAMTINHVLNGVQTTEITANNLSASLNHLYNANPSVLVRLASFSVVDTTENDGKIIQLSKDEKTYANRRTMIIGKQATEVVYSWNDQTLQCLLQLTLDDVTSAVIPEPLFGIIEFFMLPTQSSSATQSPNTGDIASSISSAVPKSSVSPSLTRSQSLTTILRAAQGPQYAMTVKILATRLSMGFPNDFFDANSTQISIGADFSVEYAWKPARHGASGSSDFDIQSSLTLDAKGVEVVIKNANRQGCCVKSTSSFSDAVSMDSIGWNVATMVQLMEPCDLHVEISDLFPHAAQQQQILSLKFSPIEVFISYEDACIVKDTLQLFQESIERGQFAKKTVAVNEIQEVESERAGILSPKAFMEADDQVEIHRYFTCEVSSMSLTVINDCDGCDMGLVQLTMQKCNMFLNVTYTPAAATIGHFPPPATAISGGGNFATLISYYNPDTRNWHPMCTEWGLDISLQGSIYATKAGDIKAPGCENQMHLIVSANHPLDLIVTHGLLEVAASAGGAWQRRIEGIASSPGSPGTPRGTKEMKKHAPCVIKNETGLEMNFWLTNGQTTSPRQMLQSGELADLHYTHVIGRGSGVVRKYASDDRSGAMRLCVQLAGTSFQAVQGIIFEQLGSRAFPLMDVSGTLSRFSLNCYAKLVDGRILLSMSSQIKFVSKLSMPVQLLVNDPTWASPVDIGVLHPYKESAIPILLSLGTELRVRPMNDSYSWSSPIPVQTRSEAELKVEASCNDGNTNAISAFFCVTIELEQSLRVVCLSEPIVLVNKLPMALAYDLKMPQMGVGMSRSWVSRGGNVGVGSRAGIWWSENQQRPQFQLTVEGCKTSRWLELLNVGAKPGEIFSIMLERYDGRPFKLLVQVVEHPAKAMHIFVYAEIWFINRTGLELVYGNESDQEAYMPPFDARALVGNAQIAAYSSSESRSSGTSPTVRICMASSNWSSRFTADPRRLSWQDECLTLRSDARSTGHGSSILYEFGVSADYSMHHFGSITTLVSVIPRYLVLNRTSHTLLLVESQSQSVTANAADHILARGDSYALYWVNGKRSKLQASLIAEKDFSWSEPFGIDSTKSFDITIPALERSKGESVSLQISIKRGSLSQSTFVVLITEAVAKDESGSFISPSSDPSHIIAESTAVQPIGWDTLSLHAQIAGVVVTLADKKARDDGQSQKNNGINAEHTSLFGQNESSVNENVARLTISRIAVELNVAPHETSGKVNVMGIKVEDLLTNSKNPVVLRPVLRSSSSSRSLGYADSGGDKSFLEIYYLEKPHKKYRWVEKLRVDVQDVKINTSMRFVDRLHTLVKETVAHFQNRSYSSLSQAAASSSDEDTNILEYFVTSSDDDASMASITGQKIYIESCEIEPVRVVVSFSRGKSDSRSTQLNMGFWLSNLKLKIENACLTLDAYKISHALATQDALVESLSSFYVKSAKSQALGLIESVQVTSLVTSMVTGGVSSLVSTIMGKTDPSLTSTSNFQYEFQTNNQIISKHSKAFNRCRSSAEFLQQIKHLVYDWDSNHTGLEARGCVALGIVNNSRHSLVVNATLNDGAELRVLPIGRKSLASVLDGNSADGRGNEWRSDRSLVVFAWGYTPTLLTSGDVYFSVQSNACNVFVTRKTARLKVNMGYTATFTHQETQSWWSSNVMIISDDIQASAGASLVDDTRNRLTSAGDPHSLFGGDATRESVLRAPVSSQLGDANDYEVIFNGPSLGIIAKQSSRSVIVRECTTNDSGGPGPALATGRISQGDVILTVNGVGVQTTTQFRDLVSGTPRPVVLRFRRSEPRVDAAYDLFGEAPRLPSGSAPPPAPAADSSFDLFGMGGN